MAVLPHLLNERWQAVAITFLVFTVVALSQDIILGKSGMFHMGQGLFFGMGPTLLRFSTMSSAGRSWRPFLWPS